MLTQVGLHHSRPSGYESWDSSVTGRSRPPAEPGATEAKQLVRSAPAKEKPRSFRGGNAPALSGNKVRRNCRVDAGCRNTSVSVRTSPSASRWFRMLWRGQAALSCDQEPRL